MTLPHLPFRPTNRLDRLIWFCLNKKIIVFLFVILVIFWGILVAPFDWDIWGVPRNPVPVDAIPDIGENQQIVYTQWPGRSPRDIEDQVTYPLTTSLLGIPGVKTVRGQSMFGFSNIYVIFNDDVEFYWSRSRVLEKLSSLSPGTLPEEVRPALGPDATSLGQVMWYVLEGRDVAGKATGGWDLHELRSIQDWQVRYALLSAEGVSEVASVGGFVNEYQIDADPNLMRTYGVTFAEVVSAVRRSNIDVGAQTIEVNGVEYIIRGVGFIKRTQDVEDALVKSVGNVPVFVRHVAHVTRGPALRRGALDKGGAEAVGGVIVVRYGANPLEALKNVKKKIAEIAPGLPRKTLSDGTQSQVRIIPFYDRSALIHETLGTLNDAILEEILVASIVIVLVVMHLGSSVLISSVLPLAVLISFIAMKLFHVDANIVALSGIAIAIGTLDDMGIIICENILKHIEAAKQKESRLKTIYRASREVGSAILTGAAITVVSFLPVFVLEGPEGKLFRPLAFTKTFALLGSAAIAVTVIPAFAQLWFGRKQGMGKKIWIWHETLLYTGILAAFFFNRWLGLAVMLTGAYKLALRWVPDRFKIWERRFGSLLAAFAVALLLASHWVPLGPEKGLFLNFIFVSLLIGGLLGSFLLLQRYYSQVLCWCLEHRTLFLAFPSGMLLMGTTVWLGFAPFHGLLPDLLKKTRAVAYVAGKFPGLGKEFMPPLDEGSYLYMPVTMPHASIGEVLEIVQLQDIRLQAIPEVESAVGKLGRAESALDPAPPSMIETMIVYRSKYISDSRGKPLRFRFDPDGVDYVRGENGLILRAPDGKPYQVRGRFIRDDAGRLIPDSSGRPFTLWRPALDPSLNPGRTAWRGVENTDDIWDMIVLAARIPGVTQAPKLQPISARIVMLQSGIRASLGVKVKGPDLETIEAVCTRIQGYLREIPSITASSVIADQIMAKPYLEIDINRDAIAQYEIDVQQVQDIIEGAVGGRRVTTTVEGRERYPVRVRYMREFRDDIESLSGILVPSGSGVQIPLAQLADIRYVRGPEAVKTEDSFMVGYVLFDKNPGIAEIDAVEHAKHYLEHKLESGEFLLPEGASFSFTGNYENHLRSRKRLKLILPLVFLIIFSILYLQFGSAGTSLLVFSCIPVAWAGGFIMLWLYAQPWFLDFAVFGINMRDLFQVHPVNLSVAVWVGFLALFGIAADDNVVMATYMEQRFVQMNPQTVDDVRRSVVEAGKKRIRPCLMTTATTILALLPVLTSTGRGSDIMIPMAIPAFGGLIFEVITMLALPVLYCAVKENRLKQRDAE